MMTDGTTLVRTLRLQYGEIPMQYDILRCKLRDKVEEDEEMVNGVSSLFAHCLPKLTRREISEAVTGAKSCCLIAVRRARDVVLQQKVKAALQGKKRALLPSVVSWLPHSAPCLPGLTKDSSQEGKGISWHEAKDGTEGSEDEEQQEDDDASCRAGDSWSLATGVDADETDEEEDGASGPPSSEENEEEEVEELPMAEVAKLDSSIQPTDLNAVTFRQRLLAAASWDEDVDNPLGLNLLQLTLIGARLKYQGFGLAHRLMAVLKDPDVMGKLDAIVVWAGVDARPWFLRQGFTDDRILNSRYERFLEHWEDSVLMSLSMPSEVLPPTAGEFAPNEPARMEYVQLERLDKSIAAWKRSRVDEYAQQLHLVNSMRAEIAFLRDKCSRQDAAVEFLTAECARCRHEKDVLESQNSRLRSKLLQYQHLDVDASSAVSPDPHAAHASSSRS